ncbi:amidohydrolase family protein [Rufibacter roseus]|uniref:Amidohydrolase family protein n=1 Tax=Rufibacter roseus TaxID=1567108 RepID=A0ABW2DJ32_9BACT|nr:amidohydrolase family protein [Rufibacter roseus]
MRIDAHQHFWQFNPIRDSWVTDDMAIIQRDFLPQDLQPLLQEHGFDGCVLVQTSQPEHENEILLEWAQGHDFIKGVVGWVDFFAPDIAERLAHLSQFKKLKGFRYVLQGAENKELMLNPNFKKGIAQLQKFNFTYDILIYPNQLRPTAELVAEFPDQTFVINHLAKPNMKAGAEAFKEWQKDMKAFAPHEQGFCKVSGMVTQADWQNWKKEDFTPYLDTLIEIFGPERLMFGSDWPVCLVAASYAETLGIVQDYFSSFSQEEQGLIFGRNAAAFYRL